MAYCGLPPNGDGRACPDGYLKNAVAMIFTQRGKNTFATLSAFTSTALETAINDVNPEDRMLPWNEIDNYAPEQADSSKATYTSGREEKIRDGIMKMSFIVVGGDGVMKAAYDKYNNGKYDVYIVDQYGGLWYRQPDDSSLDQVQGIKIAKGSFDSKLMPSTGVDVAEHISASFNWDITTDYAELRYASSTDLGFNILDFAEPLISVATPVITSLTTTTATIVISTKRGTPVTGLDKDNISELLVDGSANVVVSLIESTTTEGTYTLTYTDVSTTGDIIAPNFTGDGFDWYYADQATGTSV